MKTLIYWQIVILLFFWAWMTACGPKFTYKYNPSSDMYAGFVKDQEFCQGEAAMKYAVMRMTLPVAGGEYDYFLSSCMRSRGWNKVKVFDKPIKKGD